MSYKASDKNASRISQEHFIMVFILSQNKWNRTISLPSFLVFGQVVAVEPGLPFNLDCPECSVLNMRPYGRIRGGSVTPEPSGWQVNWRDSPQVGNRDSLTISAPCCKREVEDESRSPPGCRKRLHLRSLGTRPLVVLKQIWEQCPRLRDEASDRKEEASRCGGSSSEPDCRVIKGLRSANGMMDK